MFRCLRSSLARMIGVAFFGKTRAARVAADTVECNARADAITRGIPGSTVVRIPNADHYVHRSNEAQVIEEMKKFLDGLK